MYSILRPALRLRSTCSACLCRSLQTESRGSSSSPITPHPSRILSGLSNPPVPITPRASLQVGSSAEKSSKSQIGSSLETGIRHESLTNSQTTSMSLTPSQVASMGQVTLSHQPTSSDEVRSGAQPESEVEKVRASARTRSSPSTRKQVLKLTPRAIRQLDELLHPTRSDGQPPRLVRIGVRQKGCAGMAYDLSYVTSPGRFDEVVTGETETGREVRVMVDSRALLTIIGSVMDYEESALGSRFVFENPNVKEECGCGESFMV